MTGKGRGEQELCDSADVPEKASGKASGKFSTENDPELQAVADAWPTLPAALKSGIVAMVKAAKLESKP